MITLGAGGTISGVAGTAAVVTYTLTGDEKTTVDGFGVLKQGQLPSSIATLYTVPPDTAALVQRILLVNTSAGSVAVTLAVNGLAAANRIAAFTIPAGGMAVFVNDGWKIYDATGALVTTSLVNVTATGDAAGTGPATNVPLVLATVNANVGSFGTASSVMSQTVNAKGLTTAAANVAIQIAESQVTNLVADLAAKQPTGNYVTGTTGDVVATGPGSVPAVLATVNANVGSFGSATQVMTQTVNAKGLTTAAANVAIQIAESQVTNLVADLAAKQPTGNYVTGITGDLVATGPGSVTGVLAAVNANVGSFGSASSVMTQTVNAKGLTTAAASVPIAIAESQVTNLVTDLAGKQPTGNYLTAITGDLVATGPGSGAGTLATVNANVGSFGSATAVGTFTVNAKGLATAAGSTSIQIATSQVTGFDTQVRTSRLDQMATPTGPLSMGGQKITTGADGTNATDFVTLQQLQASAEGRKDKDAVEWSTTGNVTLSGLGTQGNGEWSGTLTAGDRILAKDQSTSADKGIYVAAAGAWTRTLDGNTGAEITGATVLVKQGATLRGDTFRQSATVAPIGTDPQTWVQIGEGDPITLASVGASPNAQGASLAGQALTLQPANGSFPGLLVAADFTKLAAQSGTNTGDVTVAAVGASPNANAASLAGQALTLQPASASFPGVITAAQFVVLNNTSGTNSGNVTLAAVGASPNANGATLTGQALNLELASAAQPGLLTAAQFTKLAGIAGSNTGDQNLFASVTGNTGTATADTTTDTLAITGATGITTAATDTPDGLVISPTYGTGASTIAQGNDTRIVNAVQTSRLVNTTAPLTGGGDLSADRTLAISAATSTAAGSMSAVDKIRMGQALDAQADLGIVGDLVTTNSTAACSTGAPGIITDSSNPFTSYYIGKRITLTGAGASGAMYVGTISSLNSAGSVNVTPNISTTVSTKICSFGTDNTTAIGNLNTLINTTNAAFPGIKIVFGMSLTNAYGFPVPVSANRTIKVEGTGGGHTADTGDYTRIGGTRLAWWGTSCDGGTAFGAFWTISPNGVQSIKRPSFRSVWLDCRNGDQNSALIALKMASCQGWTLDDFFVMDPMAIGLWLDVDTDPTEAKDCTRGLGTNLAFRCLDNTGGPVAVTLAPTTTSSAVNISTAQSLTLAAANGLRSGSDYIWVQSSAGRPFLARYTGGGGTTTLTGVVCAAEDAVHVPTTVSGSNVVQASPANSAAMYFNGGSGANTCCNTFLQVAISHGSTWGPAAVEFGNSDSNDCQSLYVNGGTRAVFGAAPNNRMTKPGVRLNGSAVSNTLASRNNTFKGGDPGSLPTTNGGVECMGLLNTGALLTAPSGPTYWEAYQLGNGAPMPVVETGASLFWSGNGSFREGGLNSLVANQSLTAAVANVVNGCSVVVPPQGWQVGTWLRWRAVLTKTAVGTQWTANIRQHSSLTAGGGTQIASAVFSASAAIDDGWLEIDLVCTAKGGSATALARYRLSKNAIPTSGLSTGVAVPAVSPNPIVTAATPGGTSFEGPMTMAAFNGDAPAGGPTFLFLELVPTTAATVMTVLPPSGVTCVKAANP